MEWLVRDEVASLKYRNDVFVSRTELERAVAVLVEDYHKSWEGDVPPNHAEFQRILRKHFGLLYREKRGFLLL